MSVIIRLQNLPMSANASNIRRFFSGLAIPEGGVHIVGGNDGDAFIAFATDEDARKAMLLDRQSINSASVRLFLSSKTEMQSVIDSARSSALFSGTVVTQPQPPVPQKTETMQALDVTAPTLPSSFPSYRNGSSQELLPSERLDQFANNPLAISSRPKFEVPRVDGYSEDPARHVPLRVPEKSIVPEPSVLDNEYEYNRQTSQYPCYDSFRDHPPPNNSDYGTIPRDYVAYENSSRQSPQPAYRSHYVDVSYDRRQPDHQHPPQRMKDGSRDDRGPYVDSHYNRLPVEHPDYNSNRMPHQDRFAPRENSREPREIGADLGNSQLYPQDRRSAHASQFERDAFPVRAQNERDFSVRPPWLNEDPYAYGPKRSYQAPEYDDYPRKRRPPPPASRSSTDNGHPSETDYVVRVSLPLNDVGVKAIFEVLRGVHIVAKWGIRIEEDNLQRPTGYVFIMMTGRDSFDRALGFDGRIYKGKPVKVYPSSLADFYRVSDPNFHLKCPPEIVKKLPSADHPISPPHHADGCLEVAELPPDTSRAEVVRFLGAPGLDPSDVTIASFAPSDKSAPKTPGSVRALVKLPSAKDIDILLSAKARPLRPDGAFPPVRLTPISRLQLDAYSTFHIEDKSKSASSQPTPSEPTVEPPKSTPSSSLTCAYVSGLSRPLKDPEVLRLFPSVLIPGDAIHMVGPENTSAYIDFISENNCRRAIADINGVDSKAKLSHPDLAVKTLSRTEMESQLDSTPKDVEAVPSQPSDNRSTRPPRDRDPRESGRSSWENRPPRVGRHPSPAAPFRSRSPSSQSAARSKFEEPYFDRPVPQPYDTEPYSSGPMRRPRPPIDVQHSGAPLPPPPNDYMPPSRSAEPMLPPSRRPGLDFVTVHISNLPSSVTVEQLAGILRDYYFVPGSIRLRRDIQGIPTGEGLIDFNSSYDGDRVIRDFNGYRMGGRPLILQYDRRP